MLSERKSLICQECEIDLYKDGEPYFLINTLTRKIILVEKDANKPFYKEDFSEEYC